jgi:lysozyme
MKVILLSCFILIGGGSAAAESAGDFSTADGWIPLQDEPSRQQLFELTKPNESAEAIQKNFVFPTDTFVDIQNVERKNSIFGVDISHYTPANFPFDQLVAQNIHYVYAKATQGVAFKDPKFAQFWNALGQLPEKQKVFRGAYHFLSSSDDPKTQAERFVAFLNLHGGLQPNDLPPVMDLEWDIAVANGPDRWRNYKSAEIVTAALMFLKRVEQLTGRTPMIYTARSWWRSVGIVESDIKQFSKYPIWIADYSRSAMATEVPAVPNNAKPDLWQFSESAKLTGFKSGVDANIFHGTEADFLSTFFP